MLDDLRHEGPLDSWGYFGAAVAAVGLIAAVYAHGELPGVAEQIEIHGYTRTNALRLQKRYQNLAGLRAAGVLAVVVGLVLVVGDHLQD